MREINWYFDIGDIIKTEKRNFKVINRFIKTRKDGKWNKNEKYYTCHCCNCGADIDIVEGTLKKPLGCPCCNNKISILGTNTIYDTDKWMIPYVGEEFAKSHTHCCGEKTFMTCPNCNNKSSSTKAVSHLYYIHKFSCEFCSDGVSYPNKIMGNLLKQLNIKYIPEYKPQWSNFVLSGKSTYCRYDFYVPDKQIIIEMDGHFHNKYNNMNGKTKEESQYIDKIKDKLANEHDIEVIRIDCEYNNSNKLSYIKNNILNSKLYTVLNLNKINWEDIHRTSSESNMIKACDIYKSGITSTKEIGEMLNLDYTTIVNYLNRGRKIGICNYTPTPKIGFTKEDYKKALATTSKRIFCLTNEILYPSISKTKYETGSCDKTITNSCKKKRKAKNGFEFRFLEDLTEEEYVKYDIENKLNELT